MKTVVKITILLLLISCAKKNEQEYYATPEVFIYNPIVINYDTTLTGGTVEGSGITSYGVCYSDHPNPTINDNFVDGTKTIGFNDNGIEFNCDLNNLVQGVQYYIRAFANQGQKTTYSYEFKFVAIPDMVRVEGSSSIKYPLQTSSEIEITGFYISKNEITNERFCQFINESKHSWGKTWINGKSMPSIAVTLMNNPNSKIMYDVENDFFYVKTGFENHPVVLSHGDANFYTEMSQCRLPTDAEWQFAAKGGKLSNGYIYSGSNNINEVAWYYDNSNKNTYEIGKKKPNELGIFDMTGNVSEWCLDYYSDDVWHYNSRPTKNPCMTFSWEHTYSSDRIFKGGSSNTPSWASINESRNYFSTSLTGFRLVYSKAKINYY